MRPIRARTIGSLTIAAVLALTACTASDGPADGASPTPQASTQPQSSESTTEPTSEETAGDVVPVDTNPDLPSTSTEGITVGEAREAGWNFHPQLPSSTEILVDLRTHTYYDGRPLAPEAVPAIWDVEFDGLDAENVNRALELFFMCDPYEEEFTYEAASLMDNGVPSALRLECVYTGTNTVGDTGKKITRVTVDDLDKQTTVDGLHVFDNVLCDLSGATPGCPNGDFAFKVTDDQFTIRIDGFDKADGTPQVRLSGRIDGSTSLAMVCFADDAQECRFGSRATMPATAVWDGDDVVTLTMPIGFYAPDDGNVPFGFTTALPDGETWRFEGDRVEVRQDDRNWLRFAGKDYARALERAADRG